MLRKLLLACLCCAILLTMCLPGLASAITRPDLIWTSKLTVHYHQNDLEFSDVEFQVYQVGDMTAQGRFTWTDMFAKYPVTMTEDMTVSDWSELAYMLSGFVAKDSLTPDYSGITDENGVCVFDDLPAGLYLITGGSHQRELIDGDVKHTYYYQAAPFLIAAPCQSETGWTYDMTVLPKFTVSEQETISIRVLKAWDDAGFASKRPDSIQFDLICDGEVYDTVQLTAADSWRYQWDGLDNSHIWRVVEHDVPGYTVKAVWQGITYFVTNLYKRSGGTNPGVPDYPIPPVDIEDPDVPMGPGDLPDDPEPSDSPDPGPQETDIPESPVPTETPGPSNSPSIPGESEPPGESDRPGDTPTNDPGNTPGPGGPGDLDSPSGPGDAPKDEPKLPQTGQLWWPVPVLSLSGMVLFAFGVILTRDIDKKGGQKHD